MTEASGSKELLESILEGVGNTPMVELRRVVPEELRRHDVHVYAKLEMRNPTGSIKDRAARQIVLDAVAQGRLLSAQAPGAKIIEATSGNMGISLAMVGCVLGIPVVIAMPANFSQERQLFMRRFGATLVLTDAALGMPGAIAKVDEMCAADATLVRADQFANPSNARAHELGTGPEIHAALASRGGVGAVVAGVGTGGTAVGTARFLRSQPDTSHALVVAVEPDESPALTTALAGRKPVPHPHRIQGIGAGFVPKLVDPTVFDAVQRVPSEDALSMAAALAREEGIFAGISSGAAVAGALAFVRNNMDIILAKKKADTPFNIVVVLPDSGDRYLSCF